eukprot:1070952-Pelagomonas_calceolata.AAC.1
MKAVYKRDEPECHMDSVLHILSGCQFPVIRSMVTERHNIASRMILKMDGEGSYGSNLINLVNQTLYSRNKERLRLPSLAVCIKERSPERQGPTGGGTTQTKI